MIIEYMHIHFTVHFNPHFDTKSPMCFCLLHGIQLLLYINATLGTKFYSRFYINLIFHWPSFGTDAADGGAVWTRMSSRSTKLPNRVVPEISEADFQAFPTLTRARGVLGCRHISAKSVHPSIGNNWYNPYQTTSRIIQTLRLATVRY